jgi:hypothetical protein
MLCNKGTKYTSDSGAERAATESMACETFCVESRNAMLSVNALAPYPSLGCKGNAAVNSTCFDRAHAELAQQRFARTWISDS